MEVAAPRVSARSISFATRGRDESERSFQYLGTYHKQKRIGGQLDKIRLAGRWWRWRRRRLLLSPGGSLQRRIIRIDGRVYVLGERPPVILAAADAHRCVRGDEIATWYSDRISVRVIDGQPRLRR